MLIFPVLYRPRPRSIWPLLHAKEGQLQLSTHLLSLRTKNNWHKRRIVSRTADLPLRSRFSFSHWQTQSAFSIYYLCLSKPSMQFLHAASTISKKLFRFFISSFYYHASGSVLAASTIYLKRSLLGSVRRAVCQGAPLELASNVDDSASSRFTLVQDSVFNSSGLSCSMMQLPSSIFLFYIL